MECPMCPRDFYYWNQTVFFSSLVKICIHPLFITSYEGLVGFRCFAVLKILVEMKWRVTEGKAMQDAENQLAPFTCSCFWFSRQVTYSGQVVFSGRYPLFSTLELWKPNINKKFRWSFYSHRIMFEFLNNYCKYLLRKLWNKTFSLWVKKAE